MYDGTGFLELRGAEALPIVDRPSVTAERVLLVELRDPEEGEEVANLRAVLEGREVIRVACAPSTWVELVERCGGESASSVLGIPVHLTSAVPTDALALVTRPAVDVDRALEELERILGR